MGYQGQSEQPIIIETLEGKQKEFTASLKEYQERATKLSLELEELNAEFASASGKLALVREDIRLAEMSLADVYTKREHIHQEIDSVMASKIAELDKQTKDAEADLEKQAQSLVEKQSAFAVEKADFQAGLKAIEDGNAALAFRESQLVVIEKILKEREEAIVAAEEKVYQGVEDIRQMHDQVDNRHTLLDARESKIKTEEDRLEQEKVSFNLTLAEHQKVADELAVKVKALSDVAVEREKLEVDLKEFKEAKTKMELREAALLGLEQQLKRWEQDLKQQEEALIEKIKGV